MNDVSRQFHTVAEVAAQLGFSERQVRRWIKSGELVASKFGSRIRIAESDLRSFIATGETAGLSSPPKLK